MRYMLTIPGMVDGEMDELFKEAVQIVVQYDRASASLIQRRLSKQFPITGKHFDNTSEPQKIVVRFTNRGGNVIRVEKVKYSQTGLVVCSVSNLT